ncbi:unnamed protein product, partial [Owenia fusiformis]
TWLGEPQTCLKEIPIPRVVDQNVTANPKYGYLSDDMTGNWIGNISCTSSSLIFNMDIERGSKVSNPKGTFTIRYKNMSESGEHKVSGTFSQDGRSFTLFTTS